MKSQNSPNRFIRISTLMTHVKVTASGNLLKRCSYVLTLTCAWLLTTNMAYALEFQCEVPGDVRYLRVDIPGDDHLCEVSVKYEYTGERRVMWYADNDTSFCSNKIAELQTKYEEAFNFSCSEWPDRDGIEQLSLTQRSIMDRQLKALMTDTGSLIDTPEVIAVKAASSARPGQSSSAMALQFFLSDGSDQTQIIFSNNNDWDVFSTIGTLAEQINDSAQIKSALISSISDSGALEVLTTVDNGSEFNCQGRQALISNSENQLTELTPHRYICYNESASFTESP